MGRTVMVKCDCGFMYDHYHWGMGWASDDIREHQTILVKNGKYGAELKRLLLSDNELQVDINYHLYQCPCCHQIYDEYSLDLIKPVNKDFHYFYSPEEVVYPFKHLCPKCKKKMKQINLYIGRFDSSKDNFEEPVICPKCGNTAIASFCGFFD